MLRSRVRMFLVVVALAAAAGLVVKLASPGGGGSAAASIDPHGAADVPASKVRRVLAATEAASTSSSQAELVSQGRAMFNDPALAKRGESCGGCHTIGTTNAALGTTPHFDADGKVIFARDPPTLVDAAKTPPYGWIGGAATLREMVLNTIFTHFKDGVSQPEDKTAEEAAALVAYISSIRAPTSSFDQGTMSAAALRGEALFQGKGACIACHGGPAFTDNGLHNTLVPNRPGWNDPGATFPPGAFNTPTLRDVRNSAPYMHNGVFNTLREVVDFYNSRSSIAPLRLTPAEIDDLVAYLEAL